MVFWMTEMMIISVCVQRDLSDHVAMVIGKSMLHFHQESVTEGLLNYQKREGDGCS